MANRYLTQFSQTFEKKVVHVFAKCTFGSSAVTLNTAKGVVSVTRNSAGTFTFVFGTTAASLDVYNRILGVRAVFNSGSSAPAAPWVAIKADNVATVGTCSCQIVTYAPTNSTTTTLVATDPASGEIGYFEFIFSDSTAP